MKLTVKGYKKYIEAPQVWKDSGAELVIGEDNSGGVEMITLSICEPGENDRSITIPLCLLKKAADLFS